MINDLVCVGKDKRVRADVMPVRIVSYGGKLKDRASLLRKKDLQVTVGENEPYTVFDNRGGKKNAFVILDFGCEFHGGVRIITKEVSAGAKIRVRLGESLAEAVYPLGEKNSTNDHSPRDTEHGLVSFSDVTFGESGFRFARIELSSPDACARIQSVTGVFVYTDLPYRGSFSCSDERLEKIYGVAAYTVHLNIQRYIWDGIKRDRLVWIGDMGPEVLAIRALFGEACGEVEKTLDYFIKNTPEDQCVNTLPSYDLWWLSTAYDWYFYTGSVKFLRKRSAFIKRLTTRLLPFVDGDGGISRFPGDFFDWPSRHEPEAKDGVRALFVKALDAAGNMLSVLGENALAAECKEKISAMRSKAGDSRGRKSVAAFLYASGVPDRSDPVETLTKGGAEGVSTFMSYFIFSALAKAGLTGEAVAIMREYYGAMLDLGATTFFEDFDISIARGAQRVDEMPRKGRMNVHADLGRFCYEKLRCSLCHGWSCGPVPFISEYVLGVRASKAGYGDITVEGFLGGLSWAKGSVATPHGDVFVSHEKLPDGGVKTTVKAPRGVKVTCRADEYETVYY